jgi:hypothetical protein
LRHTPRPFSSVSRYEFCIVASRARYALTML